MTDSRTLVRRGALVALVALTSLGALACGGRRVIVQNGQDARHQRELLRYAQRHTGCPAQALTPAQIGSGPAVWTVTGCNVPVEYWLQCHGRRCRWHRVATLNEQAAAPLQCQPQMIQQQPTQAPNMRVASGCGRQATFAIGCNGQACGWQMAGGAAPAGPAQAPPGYGASGGVQAQPGGAAQPPPDVQAAIAQQREAIAACFDNPQGVTLTVRWDASGQVHVLLPPSMQGTAAETCVQAVLSSIQIAASQAGSVTLPVQ